MKKNLLSTVAAAITALLGFNNTGFANNHNVNCQVSPDDFKTGSRNVVINDVRLSDEYINTLESTYHTNIPDGAYWYDRKCGAWGMQGGPTVGFTLAGLNLGGALKTNASNGNTGVFINGRQLHQLDVLGLQQLLGVVWPGRFWVDAWGNYGFEGGMMMGNLWIVARQRIATGVQERGPWSVYAGGGMAGGDGQGFLGAQFGEYTWFNY